MSAVTIKPTSAEWLRLEQSHAELLAALRDMQGYFELGRVAHVIRSERGEAADYDRIVRKARAAIAQAKPETGEKEAS